MNRKSGEDLAVPETYIYKPTYTYRSSDEGWDLEKDSCIEEPEVDRWGATYDGLQQAHGGADASLPIFSLSAGVMNERARTANRIDGLLATMMESRGSAAYIANIDKNLDYLFTSLQLDLIGMIALDVSAAEAKRRSAQKLGEDILESREDGQVAELE